MLFRSGAAKALVLARIFQRRPGQILVVTYQSEQAQRMWDDLLHFGIPDNRLYQIPASESRWLSNDVTDYRALGERIAALSALASGEPCIVIGTAEAVFQRTSPPSFASSPSKTLTRVVLPDPTCPVMTVKSPRFRVKLIFSMPRCEPG